MGTHLYKWQFSRDSWSLFTKRSVQGSRILLDGNQKLYRGIFLPSLSLPVLRREKGSFQENRKSLDYLDTQLVCRDGLDHMLPGDPVQPLILSLCFVRKQFVYNLNIVKV